MGGMAWMDWEHQWWSSGAGAAGGCMGSTATVVCATDWKSSAAGA